LGVELEGLPDVRPTQGARWEWDFAARGNEKQLDNGGEEEDDKRSGKYTKHGV
jgi:hypothetical protein